ncbi:PREDICTED: uncharacterized protein RP006-like [Trachymyrmex cornetzi]|uniref:uncharacterized protein RP006-like n=1 Tax=Trachymyrmex cornetzi TaxID=471704 RepID=UPI00084F27D9|nr:PREDICTED: uncharacterized protein RP006-like [Trachymyrmex cornetzi]
MFIELLFGIESEIEEVRKKYLLLEALLSCQRKFVQRRVAKQLCITNDVIYSKIEKAISLLTQEGVVLNNEISFAEFVTKWQKDKDKYVHLINAAEIYTVWVLRTEEGEAKHKNSVLFKFPRKKDYENLVDRKEKDFCSIGAKNKNCSNESFSINPLAIELTGCPLEEKISAMNYLKKQGYVVSALATAVIDNPMVAATGDSRNADGNTYQKQLPVDIPLLETENLYQVLNLPYGFEIYNLLTRWNPLKFKHYLPKEINQYKVLIAGLGPAGFTLAHYLLNAGFTVVAIDGLKIEPLAPEISGIDQLGRRHNFKDLIIALALGAGKPNIPDIHNVLVKGVITASDSLMTLQLLGSHLEGSIASLQIRLPILVIGGGLTAIDTAAESLAYYPLQVERFLRTYEKLGPKILNDLNEEKLEIAQEFMMHAAIIREAPEKKLTLLNKWGGMKVVYRKSMQESPSYRLNHEEVQKALEEGVEFIDNIIPQEIEVDRFPTGTHPNTTVAHKDAEHFKLNGTHFVLVDEKNNPVVAEKTPKPKNTFILSDALSNPSISHLDDMHVSYSGNVVKAMDGRSGCTGAWVNKELGLVGVIVLKTGASSDACATLKKGDVVSFVGPTGTPTEIPKNKNVMLVDGGLGNAVLFSIGKALRENDCRVLYFAGYKKAVDRYKIDEIEDAADSVVWCCQESLLKVRRSSDYSAIGNIIDGIASYDGTLIKLSEIEHIIVIISDKMMKAFEEARHSRLKNLFKWPHVVIASIKSPMQCMMKEICAQCLQIHVDPITKKESYVYSCRQQDQILDFVDFNHLELRLSQNSLQEKFIRKMRLNTTMEVGKF